MKEWGHPTQTPEHLWHPETEPQNGELLWFVLDGHVCGVVMMETLYPDHDAVPDWVPSDLRREGPVRVRACEALRRPNGATIWGVGELIWTAWKYLRYRDEEMAAVEAYWIINGVES